MSWRSDKRKNKTIENKEKQVEVKEPSERNTESLHKVQKAQVEVTPLKKRVEELKEAQERSEGKQKYIIEQTPGTIEAAGDLAFIKKERQEEAVRAAERAVLIQAEKDMQKEQERLKARQERADRLKSAETEIRIAEKNIEKKEREAEKKRLDVIEAEKKAAEVSFKKNRTAEDRERRQEIIDRGRMTSKFRKQREAEKVRKTEKTQKTEEITAKVEKEEKAEQKKAEREQRERRAQEKQGKKVPGRKTKLDRQKLIEEQRAIQKEKRRRRAEEKQRQKLARKSAEMGRGIVKVHGTEVSTEIKPVAKFSWLDLFSKDNPAKEQAREGAIILSQFRQRERARREDSKIKKNFDNFKDYCERRKKPLLILLSLVFIAVIGSAGWINHYTAFEYSYNGKVLGYVKSKDVVFQITDLVQEALIEDKDMEISVDAKEDISFNRVPVINRDITIDSSDDVLRRLTYVGNLNIKACGIYIDGKKIGAVENKETAVNVLQTIKGLYASGKEGSKVEEAVILEDIEIKESNTSFSDIMSEIDMVEKLCTSGEKETIHTIIPGETLSDIALDYGLKEEDVLAVNEGIDPKKLDVGSTIIIRQNAPLLTVKISEVRTYEKKTPFKTEKKNDKNLYEGYTEVDVEGVKGTSRLTERTTSVNGDTVDKEILNEKVMEQPVTEVIRVGTKERPPTVGSGTYIWPTNGSYRISSRFGPRWGRHHDGIDLACRTGTDVLASDGGTVTRTGYHGSYGLLVVIDHQNGYETYYAHNSKILVSKGDKVFQGQHIAESGNTGRSTGSHIHFGIKEKGRFVNPERFLP